MSGLIPLRPNKGKRYGDLSKEEQNCLTWYLLSGDTRLDCFLTFCRPELRNAKTKKMFCDQFFATAAVRDYLNDYKETLILFLAGETQKASVELVDEQEATSGFRNKVAKVMGEANSLEELDTAAKLGKTVGLLSDEMATGEAPRRYLPELCSQCRYRQFVESAIDNGEVEDCCPKCRALAFAKSYGFRYDPTKLLNP